MNLLTPGRQSISLFDYTFVLVSQVRFPHQSTSDLNHVVKFIPFWTRQCRTLSMAWILFSQNVDTPELDAPFDETDAIPFSISSGFCCLVITASDTSRLQLAPSIKSHNLGAKLEISFCLCHRQVKYQLLS